MDDREHPTCRSRRHEPGKAHPLVPGRQICADCLEAAEETLLDLPWLFDLCANGFALRADTPTEGAGEIVQQGVVTWDSVIMMRAEILGVLATWCGLITGERGVSGPDELSIRNLVGFLGIHLHWLSQHREAPKLVDALTGLSAAVGAVLLPEPSVHGNGNGNGNQNGNGNGGRSNGNANGHRHQNVTGSGTAPRPENAT